MNILVIGAGGVGSSIAAIAQRRSSSTASSWPTSPSTGPRPWSTALDDGGRFTAARVDAGRPTDIVEVARAHAADVIVNACDPRLNHTIFAAALAARCAYIDMAMSLSAPHPDHPFTPAGVKLGDDQFAMAEQFESAGLLALVGMGVEPGLSDVFARYAADHLFDEIDEIGVRDGSNLSIDGYEFAPTFSIWTTIEECLNPPLIWEKAAGWYTTECAHPPRRPAVGGVRPRGAARATLCGDDRPRPGSAADRTRDRRRGRDRRAASHWSSGRAGRHGRAVVIDAGTVVVPTPARTAVPAIHRAQRDRPARPPGHRPSRHRARRTRAPARDPAHPLSA